jgi:hypothetical protein
MFYTHHQNDQSPLWRQEEKGDFNRFRSLVKKDSSPFSQQHSISYPDFWEEEYQRRAEIDLDIDFTTEDEEEIA